MNIFKRYEKEFFQQERNEYKQKYRNAGENGVGGRKHKLLSLE